MIHGIGELPAAPVGERVLIHPDPPIEEGKTKLIIFSDQSLKKNFSGVIKAAGLAALDKMYDAGLQVGDHVWYGQFAGIVEAWDHMATAGDGKCKEHDEDSSWSRSSGNARNGTRENYACNICGAQRWVEGVVILNVDDILASESLEVRIRSGQTSYKRGKTESGQTQHHIVREET